MNGLLCEIPNNLMSIVIITRGFSHSETKIIINTNRRGRLLIHIRDRRNTLQHS